MLPHGSIPGFVLPIIFRKEWEISNAELAEKYRFRSSPTILVNGQDIFGAVIESDCGCCGEISGTQVDCRVFEHEGITWEVPTKKMLTDAILKVQLFLSDFAIRPECVFFAIK